MKKNSSLIILITLLTLITWVSCEEALERNISDKKVTLLAPANNMITNDTLHTFYWNTLEGASQYRLQVVSPRFDSIVRLIADTPLLRNTFIIDLNTGDYQWRVKAQNSAYSSELSDTWNLKIQ